MRKNKTPQTKTGEPDGAENQNFLENADAPSRENEGSSTQTKTEKVPLRQKISDCVAYLRQKAAANIKISGGFVSVRPVLAWVIVAVLVFSLILGATALGLVLEDYYKPQSVYAKVAPSVVDIVAYNANDIVVSHGTGFFITSDGEIATCYHVITNCVKLLVTTYDGGYYIVNEIVSYDAEKDIAILKIDADSKPLALSGSTPKAGQRVYAVSNYISGSPSITEGLIMRNNLYGTGDGFTHSASITYGSSGGPIVDENGRVMGIIKNIDESTYNSGGAVSVNFLGQAERVSRTMEQFLIESGYDIGHLLDYTVASDQTLTITGVKAVTSRKYVTIPAYINGHRVKTIDINPISSSEKLVNIEHISIAEGVESIRDNSFLGATKLLSVALPSTLTNIQTHAFAAPKLAKIFAESNPNLVYENKALLSADGTVLYFYARDCVNETFNVPDTVKYISQGAFANNPFIKTVYLSKSLLQLGSNYTSAYFDNVGAFENCSNLGSVVFDSPDLMLIGPETFSGCLGLEDVQLPSKLLYIGDRAFSSCSNLDAVVFRGETLPIFGDRINYRSNFTFYAEPQAIINAVNDAGRTDVTDYLSILKYIYFYEQ